MRGVHATRVIDPHNIAGKQNLSAYPGAAIRSPFRLLQRSPPPFGVMPETAG
jgi:hypothetical protein